MKKERKNTLCVIFESLYTRPQWFVKRNHRLFHGCVFFVWYPNWNIVFFSSFFRKKMQHGYRLWHPQKFTDRHSLSHFFQPKPLPIKVTNLGLFKLYASETKTLVFSKKNDTGTLSSLVTITSSCFIWRQKKVKKFSFYLYQNALIFIIKYIK